LEKPESTYCKDSVNSKDGRRRIMCHIYGYDLFTILNMMICVLILATGSMIYYKTKNKTPFHIGVAFGLFAIGNLIKLFGVQASFVNTVLLVNVFGYLIVLFALYDMTNKK
jgi:hypothetical protein